MAKKRKKSIPRRFNYLGSAKLLSRKGAVFGPVEKKSYNFVDGFKDNAIKNRKMSERINNEKNVSVFQKSPFINSDVIHHIRVCSDRAKRKRVIFWLKAKGKFIDTGRRLYRPESSLRC